MDFANASVQPLSHLAGGGPGCWKKFHGGAMTKAEVNRMSLECQQFREDYFASINLARKSPDQFEKKLIQTLVNAKKAMSPYEATFFAMVIHTDKLKEALKKRAEVEKKLDVAFPYAEVALYRLSGQDCGLIPQYLNLAYEDMCVGEDTILPVYFLPAGKAQTNKGKSK
jgi:hypothetical protein